MNIKSKEERIIEEIEDIRSMDLENGSYITATVNWMYDLELTINRKNVEEYVPSYIIKMIKEEAYEDFLVQPSNNPKVDDGDGGAFLDLFF